VTDENRKGLMPSFVQSKLGVLENYTNRYFGNTKKKTNKLTIFFNGTLSDFRGTKILQDLTRSNTNIRIIMAGWFSDENTKDFANSNAVDYVGIIPQNEATEIAATKSDYIMCCYQPSNQNNINASPNKIYDAIQTKTPVIMNGEVKVAAFVKENNIGVVLKSFYNYNPDKLYTELTAKKDTFSFSEERADLYSWEKVEHKLLKAHGIN
jgi:hypothetical protein